MVTAKALQRVVVRMLYDPAFVDSVYADAESALVGVSLTGEERTWLVAPDRRRWRADPLRRTRGLGALLEEYPVAGALLARRDGVAALDAFFSTPSFHRCIQERGSLGLTFGRWLGGHPDPLLAGIAEMESAVAAVRRAGSRQIRWTVGQDYVMSPLVAVRLLPGGTMAAFAAIRGILTRGRDDLIAAVVDCALELGLHPIDPDDLEGLIVEAGSEVTMGDGPLGLIRVLMAAETPIDARALGRAFIGEGATLGEVPDLIADLLQDGLLVACPR